MTPPGTVDDGAAFPRTDGTSDRWKLVGIELTVLTCTVGPVIANIPSLLGAAPEKAASEDDSTDTTGAFLAKRLKPILPVTSQDVTFDGKRCCLAERCVSLISCAYLAIAWKYTLV